jgi:arylformamidase
MKIYDISIPIKNKMIVYPNNPETEIVSFAKMPKNSSALTKITMGSHTGTHLDAPSHAIIKGKTITDLDLKNFFGQARVFDFSYIKPGSAILEKDFDKVGWPTKNEIVLIKTSNSKRGYNQFYDDFVYLDGATALKLASKKIKLFGIDYLSVKQKGGKDNRSHTALLSKDIPILEGINLEKVSAGNYEFIALPLKLDKCDGSPTRAILISR